MTTSHPVAVLDDYQQVAEDLVDWSRAGIEVTSFPRHLSDEDELVEALAAFSAPFGVKGLVFGPR